MKDLKITIKCKGLSVRTNDLNMGLGILDEIDKRGIMNHSFISNDLLDKGTKLIGQARERIATLMLMKRVKESFEGYKFASAPEDKRKDIFKGKKDSTKRTEETIPDKEETKSTSVKPGNAWTEEEKDIIRKNLQCPIKKLSKFLPGRSEASIEYMKRNVQGLNDKYKKRSKSKGMHNKVWTSIELSIMKNNMHLMPRQLATFTELKGRKLTSIAQKKHELKKNS